MSEAAGADRAEEQRADAPARPDRTLRLVALVLAGFALVGLVYNLVATMRTLDRYPGARFWEVLLATSGDDPLSTAWFTAIVWTPAILTALAAALLLLSLLPALRSRGAARR
ncbi:hypothetical protein [Arenivirga flava]|uniref:Uncharacterized protein n=1 Tax=Arenivirga flava TaxID=1930060 RepID=A0AA37UNY5_9MICO|nr:hypothetical protein [Arenivirga flava]GMA28446.1 hypothetical protein GCM10025874_16990 [Arenivirga flava]